VKRIDRDAMKRSIDAMRAESPDCAKEIDDKIRCEGFEAAGEFAADRVQSANLKLRPWETSPCNIWGYDQSKAIALRDRLVAAGLSVFEPDPVTALREAARQQAVRQQAAR
jgi:hypothetical protein